MHLGKDRFDNRIWGCSCQESPIVFPYLCMIPNMYLISHADPTIDSMRPARDSIFTFDLLLSSLAGESCILYLAIVSLLSSLAVRRRLRRSALVWGLGHQAKPCHRCTTLCCDRDRLQYEVQWTWDCRKYLPYLVYIPKDLFPSSATAVSRHVSLTKHGPTSINDSYPAYPSYSLLKHY